MELLLNITIHLDLVPAMNPFGQYKGRLSGSRIIRRLRLPPPQACMESGIFAVFVPDYGNGWHATESHRFSYYPGYL